MCQVNLLYLNNIMDRVGAPGVMIDWITEEIWNYIGPIVLFCICNERNMTQPITAMIGFFLVNWRKTAGFLILSVKI